jgi:hypothetical protein
MPGIRPGFFKDYPFQFIHPILVLMPDLDILVGLFDIP